MVAVGTSSGKEGMLVCIPSIEGNLSKLETLLSSLDQRYGLFEQHSKKIASGNRIVFRGGYFGFGTEGFRLIDYLSHFKDINSHQATFLLGNPEIEAITSAKAVGRRVSVHQKFIQLFFEGKSKRESLEDIFSLDNNGYLQFIEQFDAKSFDSAASNYFKSISRNGQLRKWIDALEPFYTCTFSGQTFLFTEGDSFPEDNSPSEMRALIETHGAIVRKYRQFRHRAKFRKFTREHFHSKPYAKREYISGSSDIEKFANEVGYDFIITGLTGEEEIYMKNPRLIKLGHGFSKLADPAVLLIKESGIYKFSSSSDERELMKF